MTWIVPSRSKTELYGRPRAAGVRGGLIVRAHSALPCISINWAISIYFVRTLQRLACFGNLKSVRSPIVPPAAAPSSSPLSPNSELVSLSRPCLPRTDFTPLLSVVVIASRAVALFSKGVIVALVRSIRVAVEATGLLLYIGWGRDGWLTWKGTYIV